MVLDLSFEASPRRGKDARVDARAQEKSTPSSPIPLERGAEINPIKECSKVQKETENGVRVWIREGRQRGEEKRDREKCMVSARKY